MTTKPSTITVGRLFEILQDKLEDGQIMEDFHVAVWVKDGRGAAAKDLSRVRIDIDHEGQFIAFALDD